MDGRTKLFGIPYLSRSVLRRYSDRRLWARSCADSISPVRD
nr:MAG TPA: hypothetical protein [Caudoviricetes sp.]